MIERRFNLVTFLPDDEGASRLFLKLESEWILSAGIEPNVNSAVVPYTEFNKLGSKIGRTGTIEFWHTSSPLEGGNKPDTLQHDVCIVDVEPLTVGIPHQDLLAGVERVVEFRLIFADFRRRLVAPRGGLLKLGLVNPEPNNKAPILSNKELIDKCLEAIGTVSFSEAPATVNKIKPPRNLNWLGSHAPTELAKVLAHCHAVFCPDRGGGVSIYMIGDGDEPVIAAEDLLFELKLGELDRRGKTVVITSAPTAVVHTITKAYDAAPPWDFVYQEADDWTLIGEGSQIADFIDAADQVREGFAAIPETNREQLRSQLFYCIQLNTEAVDPAVSKLLRLQIDKDGNVANLKVKAKIAVPTAVGTWKNSKDFVTLNVKSLDQGNNVLQVDQRLGKIKLEGTGNSAVNVYRTVPENLFEVLDDDEWYVEYSVEAFTDGADGAARTKEFFNVGYTAEVGGDLTKLSDDEVKVALESGGDDVVIYPVPHLRLVRMDDEVRGKEAARAALEAEAKAIAQQVLKGSGDEAITRMARGFVGADITGKISEIRWDQATARTTFKLNSWWTPAGSLTREQLKSPDVMDALPQQNKTAPSKLFLGEDGATQAMVPVGNTRELEARRREVHGRISKLDAGRGNYEAHIFIGGYKYDPIADAKLSSAQYEGETVKVVNNWEASLPDTVKCKHVMSVGDPFIGYLGEAYDNGGTPMNVVHVAVDPFVMRAYRLQLKPDGKLYFQGSRTRTPAADDNWEDLIPFKRCTTA
jgi:hypothetical protein